MLFIRIAASEALAGALPKMWTGISGRSRAISPTRCGSRADHAITSARHSVFLRSSVSGSSSGPVIAEGGGRQRSVLKPHTPWARSAAETPNKQALWGWSVATDMPPGSAPQPSRKVGKADARHCAALRGTSHAISLQPINFCLADSEECAALSARLLVVRTAGARCAHSESLRLRAASMHSEPTSGLC